MKEFTPTKLFLGITLTLFFFASNSLLCRWAMAEHTIDAYSFTFLRLLSGALALQLILYYKNRSLSFDMKKNWLSSFMLFCYAISLSYAYIDIDTGLGALILFAIVQLSMVLSALFLKEVLPFQKIIGLAVAFMGLGFLLFPKGDIELSYIHVLLMMLSGLAWAVYTLLGKKSVQPLKHTADNFLKSLVYVAISFIFIESWFVSLEGLILALISGAITSGIGYALWYFLLPKITIITASVVQLIVPVIAIFLGLLFLQEEISLTLIISTVIILSGILLCITKKA